MRINTNIESLQALFGLHKLEVQIKSTLEKLSTGYKINHAADDPSGVAITAVMRGQIGGIDVAIQNLEDAVNLIQTADGGIAELVNMNYRIRDLQVRGANAATETYDDLIRLLNEINQLRFEISRSAASLTFNSKNVLDGTFNAGQAVQVGPDNGAIYRISISIPDLSLSGYGGLGPNPVAPPPPNSTVGVGSIAVAFAANISYTDAYINALSNVRASLGVQQRRFTHIINDLQAAKINLSAANSRIIDAELACEISALSRFMIVKQAAQAALAQANANPQNVIQLLR